MIIYSLGNEVWKLESKLEMFQKQLEIKNVEMETVNDKVNILSRAPSNLTCIVLIKTLFFRSKESNC